MATWQLEWERFSILTHLHHKTGGNFTTLPEYFKENGYPKIFHPGSSSGGDDPVSWSEPYWQAPNLTYWDTPEASWIAVPRPTREKRPLPDEQIAEHALETLRRVVPKAKTGEQPCFVDVGLHKPHLHLSFLKSSCRCILRRKCSCHQIPTPLWICPCPWSTPLQRRNGRTEFSRSIHGKKTDNNLWVTLCAHTLTATQSGQSSITKTTNPTGINYQELNYITTPKTQKRTWTQLIKRPTKTL